jgi:ribosomal protein S18 acetylase RimI-like enzyme
MWIVLVAGVEQVYVHVHKNNSVAQELYQKTGFKVIKEGSNSLL